MVIGFSDGVERKSTRKEPLSKIVLAHKALELNCSIKELCIMCGAKIRTLIFRGTGVCCEDCRKDRDGDHSPAGALSP